MKSMSLLIFMIIFSSIASDGARISKGVTKNQTTEDKETEDPWSLFPHQTVEDLTRYDFEEKESVQYFEDSLEDI